MLKPSAPRGWVCALCTVPVLAIVALALLALSPASRHTVASAKGIRASQPVTPAARGRVQAHFAALPLAFEENKGQTDAQVEYMARGNGYTLFLTANDAVFSLHSASAASKISTIRSGTQLRAKNLPKQSNTQDSTAAVRMQLAGGNAQAKVSASGQLPGKSNYFIGNDPSKWQKDVAHYARVSYQDVYPGVNLAFHGAQRQVEFDFVVAAGANPAPIGFHFTGAQNIKTDDSGNLVVSSTAGEVLLHKPVAYQEQNGARQPVDAQFILRANNQVSFDLGNYDHNRELVIDPSVSYEYSTYLGGSAEDQGYGIAFDSSGDALVTGVTASQNFPGTTGGFTGTAQAFVSKIAADGSSLIYSTYIGGSGNPGDSGNAIAVDQVTGNAYVAGGTTSSDFPVVPKPGAYQTTLKGSGNAFVLELGTSGTIIYSTYLGGTGSDRALGIALDSTGNVYAAGSTSSTNFPTTSSPLQGYLTGSSGSGFLTKLNPTGTALVYSTYVGGSSGGIGDAAGAVALDSSDNAYVTGETHSSSFHTTTGVLQSTCGSCPTDSNSFVTVINPAGTAYIYSTFLGGNGIDVGYGIAVDSTDNAYVAGTTTSTNFPTTAGTLQPAYGSGASSDAFVAKINPTGSALVYSTYLGGSGVNQALGIAIDGSNNAYVTGSTSSTSFPTANPTQAKYAGGNTDAFVSELNASGSALVFSTFLGGTGDEDANNVFGAIAVDGAGDSIYVTGNTTPAPATTNNFPTTSGTVQPNPGGGVDAFVAKYSQPVAASFTLSATALSPASVSPGGSSTSMVTVTPDNGFSGTVTLTCAVSGPSGAIHVPTCAAASATTAAPATLTVNTTAATALLQQPLNNHPSGLFYAMFLPMGGLALFSLGSTGPRRKKLFGFLLLGLMISGLFLMPACSSGSSGGGGGGGSPGTTAGAYTITVSGTASGGAQTGTSPALTLTVN